MENGNVGWNGNFSPTKSPEQRGFTYSIEQLISVQSEAPKRLSKIC